MLLHSRHCVRVFTKHREAVTRCIHAFSRGSLRLCFAEERQGRDRTDCYGFKASDARNQLWRPGGAFSLLRNRHHGRAAQVQQGRR